MRAGIALLVLLAALGVAAAGCGGGEEVAPLPETVQTDGGGQTETGGETETEGETETGGETAPEGGGNGEAVEGDPEAGRQVFTGEAGCGGCHTLEAAGTSGTIGPNLDEAQPEYDAVVQIVTNGRGAMPAFSGTLGEEQIQNVAAFVYESTRE